MIFEINSSGNRIVDANLLQELSLNLQHIDRLTNGQTITINVGSGVIKAQKINLRYSIRFYSYTDIDHVLEKENVPSNR